MKDLDKLALIVFPVLAVGLSLALRANLLLSTLLFFGLPACYWSIRTPRGVKRALLFSLVFTPLCALMGGYLAVRDNSWFTPTIFQFRILGEVAVEEIIWSILAAYFVVILYVHFYDQGKHPAESHRLKDFFTLILALFVVFLSVYFLNSDLLRIPYAYLILAIGGLLVPLVLFLISFPRFLTKFVKAGLYLFILAILHELTSLNLGQWFFPGKHFIGWVELFNYRFPFEEFIFLALSSIAALSLFEYYDDDMHLKKR